MRVSDFSIPAKPLSRNFCSCSSTTTSKPAVAATCAMPEPINPQPSTPTFLISMISFSFLYKPNSLGTHGPTLNDCHPERSEGPLERQDSNLAPRHTDKW